jgi:hypothetical protein
MQLHQPELEQIYRDCRRSQDGQITSIVTPTGRVESIGSRCNPNEFGKLVEQSSRPGQENNITLPGIAAWQYVAKYLIQTDQVWTYGFLDAGFVVIRNNRVFCLVVTSHML